MSVVKALEIEKLKPIKNGVYVCIDEKEKKFEIIPIEKVGIQVNGKQFKLSELLFNLQNDITAQAKEINDLKRAHNSFAKAYKKQIASLQAQILELQGGNK